MIRCEVIGNATLYLGDCLERLREMQADSIDVIVTDPPYGLAFMGKKWDYDVPSLEVWAECLRVLKPGGHLLAFAGTRTQHRMAVRIEDAGFEIRDMIAWVYGSGFPKSLDVSKAIDKAAGVAGGYGERKPNVHSRGDHVLHEGWKRPWQDDPDAVDKSGREYLPGSDAARQWQGWGTALKPALEPITVARKPLVGTVAENVLAHGTGALNIDGCRVDGEKASGSGNLSAWRSMEGRSDLPMPPASDLAKGRWPANLIHDGSDEVLAAFPQAKGQQGALTGQEPSSKTANTFGDFAIRAPAQPRGDAGSAARFFYCAKASRADRNAGLQSGDTPAVGTAATMREREDADWKARNGNHHPTVKPTDLMRYLCRLVTPPGGVVLDPFMGSGSTGKAAVLEGFRFVGIEREPEYFDIACKRIEEAQRMTDMFGFNGTTASDLPKQEAMF